MAISIRKKDSRKRKSKAATGPGLPVASSIVPLSVIVSPGGIPVGKATPLDERANSEKLIKKDLLRSLVTGAGIYGLMLIIYFILR
jgi:hypothetical protein